MEKILLLLLTRASAHFQNYLHPFDIFSYNIEPDVRRNSFESAKLSSDIPEKMTCGDLDIDEACVIVKSNVDHNVTFKYQSIECDQCSLLDEGYLQPSDSQKIVLKFASLGTVWNVVNEQHEIVCRNESYFGENSTYLLSVNGTGCYLDCLKEPENVYKPILFALGLYMMLAMVWILGCFLKRKQVFGNLFHRNSLDISSDLAAVYSSSSTVDDSKQKAPQKRLRSLDTVRGIAIVVMIFVNYGGGKYWFFDHSIWNGLTVADLVFPWFIWMMGMSLALSLRSQLRKAIPRRKIFLKIVKRSAILFALGIMLNTYCQIVDVHKLRIPGVLQRFSICYFVVATVHLIHASAEDEVQVSQFRDIFPYLGEWLIMLTILTTHILLTIFVHPHGCPRNYLGPGGLHCHGNFSNCTGGAAGYIDRIFLGESHLYQRSTIKSLYKNTLPYDPEGILGYLTSIFLVYLGLQAGKILLCYKEPKERVLRWLIWACILGFIAAVLCECKKNGGIIPVNKNLWSVSFIMATGSMAFLLISFCYFTIDVQKWWSGAPFFYAGMNSIMLYLGHSLTSKMFPWRWEVEDTHMNLLFQDLLATTLWILISVWMFYKKVFITI